MGMGGVFGKVGRIRVLQVLAALYCCAPAQAAPWPGGGTDAEPYLVRDADGIVNFADLAILAKNWLTGI